MVNRCSIESGTEIKSRKESTGRQLGKSKGNVLELVRWAEEKETSQEHWSSWTGGLPLKGLSQPGKAMAPAPPWDPPGLNDTV